MSKILVIEDDPVLLKMYANKLKSSNHQVFTAMDGEKGIEDAINHQPDFIILDLMMPKLNGHQVLKRLKEKEETKNIPVAILSVVQQDLAERDNPNLSSQTVAYWRKDETTPSEVISKAEEYLKEHTNG